MKHLKRITAVISALALLAAGTVSALAASQEDVISALAGFLSGDAGNVNISKEFSDWLSGVINEKSTMDTIIDNFRKGNGSPTVIVDDTTVLDPEEAAAVAELVNVSLMDIKRVNPGFTKTEYAALPVSMMREMEDFGGIVSAMIGAVTTNHNLVAAIISNSTGDEEGMDTAVTETTFSPGSNATENMSVIGQPYVADVNAEDIKDYTVRLSKTGAFSVRVEFLDRWPDQTDGIKKVFDIPDTSRNTLLKTAHMDIKYVDCALELTVDKYGRVKSYVTNLGCAFCMEQADGTYTTRVPVFNMDTQESGLIYTLNTTYNSFEWADRAMGDADGDGLVTAADARLALRCSANLEKYTADNLKFMDADGDGILSAGDARIILRVSANLQKFPAQTRSVSEPYERPEYQQEAINQLSVLMTSYAAAKRQREIDAAQQAYLESLTAQDEQQEQVVNPPTGMNTTEDKANEWMKFITGFLG